MNRNYNRVIPRDLFNESKLLKCIGRLILLIHDNQTPVDMGYGGYAANGDKFEIALMDEGSLTIVNLEISICGKLHLFKTTYNSKENYPLFVETQDLSELLVFDENGIFTNEFNDYCINNTKNKKWNMSMKPGGI